jgi:DNA-binding response OmpR family regulator
MQSKNRPTQVLYADSNEDDCFMLSKYLEFSNIEVQSAQTIDEAIEIAETMQFDLYLLDTRFPEGDGLELCQKLKELNAQIPIVFYSGEGYETNKIKGIAVGAKAYLVKPDLDAIAPTIFHLTR